MPHEFRCPSCAVTLRTSAPVPPGKKIRCPKCNTIYVQPAGGAASPPRIAAPAAQPPARQAPAARPAPAPAVEEVLEAPEPSGAQQARPPRRPSLLGRLPRKIRKAVVQGMMLAVLGGLLLYGLVLAATFPAFDRALSKANELAQEKGTTATYARTDPGTREADPGDNKQVPKPQTAPGNPQPAANPISDSKSAEPWHPSEDEKRITEELVKLGVSASQQEDGWHLDLESAKDLGPVVKLLPQLSRVATAQLGGSAGDTHLPVILRLKGLVQLSIHFNKTLTDAGFEHLGEATGLKQLDFWFVEKMTSATAARLASLTNLEELTLSNLTLGNKALPHLAGLRHLHRLVLTNCGLTEGALPPLAGLTELGELSLSYNQKLPGQELRHIAALKQLTRLDLRGIAVEDRDLSHVAELTNLAELNLGETAISDAGLVHLARLTRVESLTLTRTRVKGPGLQHLAGMKDLRSLTVWQMPDFTGEGLQHLAGAAGLAELDLSSAGVTDAGLAQIKQLSQVTTLRLPPYGSPDQRIDFWRDPHPERLSDRGVQHIGAMTALKDLSLSGSGITDAGLAPLANLKNLVGLSFGFLPNVKGPGLEHLKGLSKLERLNLKHTGVTDETMKYVKDLTQLQEIFLPMRITDTGLEAVKGMKKLRSIYVYGLVSDKAVAELTKAFPEADIEHVDNRAELKAEAEGPPEKQQALSKALEKLSVETSYDSEKGWYVDLSSTTDLDAALKLLPRLEKVAGLNAGPMMTNAQLAAVVQLKGLEQLSLQNNDQITDDGLSHLRQANQLTELELGSLEKVTAKGLAHLAGLKGLHKLAITEMELKDEGTRPLAALKGLRILELPSCELDDASLQHLAGSSELRQLTLKGNGDLTGAGLKHLAGLARLERLDLSQTGVEDAGLEHLAGLTTLTRLTLSGCRVSDAGLHHLAGLNHLTTLQLDQTDVKGSGLQHLAGMKDLSSLEVENKDFTGEGLQHLTGCKKLTVLALGRTGITDAGLAQIKKLKQVTSLSLPDYGLGEEKTFWADPHPERLTDRGLAHVGEMTDLEVLSVSGSGITDNGLAPLGRLKKLRELSLKHLPNVKGPGLEHLKGLSHLTELNLAETGVTDEGVKHVKVLMQLTSLILPRKATDAALAPLKEMNNLEQVTVFKGVSEKAVSDLEKALPKTEVVRLKEE